MLGNRAVARGLYESGCEVLSAYPGTPSTEIAECAAAYDDIYCEWAPNEKVAMEVAFGASLAGRRSFCCMKHVGLNVAADPLFTMSYTGVGGGLVIAVADDPGNALLAERTGLAPLRGRRKAAHARTRGLCGGPRVRKGGLRAVGEVRHARTAENVHAYRAPQSIVETSARTVQPHKTL